MKTKSILVMVLAALMLFSFTACEQKVPAKDVVNVTVKDPSSFTVYAGKAFETETYINIERLDDTVDTVIGTIKVADPEPGRNTATVSWTTGEKEGNGKVFVDAIGLSGALTVTFDEEKITDEDGNALISNLEGVKAAITAVSAKYSDGTDFPISAGYNVKFDVETGAVEVTYNNAKYTTETLTFTTTIPVKETPATKTDVKRGEVTAIEVKWYVDEKEVATGNTYTAKVGDVVSYKVFGLAADMTNRNPLELKTTDNTLAVTGTIKSTALDKTDITENPKTETFTPAEPQTATVQFLPSTQVGDDGKLDPNFESVIKQTITLRVADTLLKTKVDAAVAAANFKYLVDEDGTATKITVGKETTITASDFTTTVETEGGIEVVIQGVNNYGGSTWTVKPESATPATIGNFTFKWHTTDSKYGYFEDVVTGVTVGVEAAQETGNK